MLCIVDFEVTKHCHTLSTSTTQGLGCRVLCRGACCFWCFSRWSHLWMRILVVFHNRYWISDSHKVRSQPVIMDYVRYYINIIIYSGVSIRIIDRDGRSRNYLLGPHLACIICMHGMAWEWPTMKNGKSKWSSVVHTTIRGSCQLYIYFDKSSNYFHFYQHHFFHPVPMVHCPCSSLLVPPL